MKADMELTDTGRYYKQKRGGSSITFSKILTENCPFQHGEKLLIKILDEKIVIETLGGVGG